MGIVLTPRASYKPLGRQPFRPGQWQGYKAGSSHTTYIQNNFFGSSYNSGLNYNYGYNYDNGGLSKGMKWLLGIGIGTSLLGGILKLFGVGSNNNAAGISGNNSNQNASDPDSNTTINGNHNTLNQNSENDEIESEDENTTVNTNNETQQLNQEQADTKQDILKVEKQEINQTTNYTVQYGDTWANIIMAKYKDENGNPISFADAKELWTQLKEECGVSKDADGMPSNIELPNEFKNYKLDINGKVTANTNFENKDYKNYDGQAFKAKTTTKYSATGTINGKSIGTVSGSGKEVTEQLRAKGFSDKDIKTAMQSGEVKITKQTENENS